MARACQRSASRFRSHCGRPQARGPGVSCDYAGVAETLRGLTRQTGVNQKQARPLDADALAAIRATAFIPRRTRGGSLESEESALKRGRLDIALASVLSDAGLRVSEAAQLRLRDVLDAEDGAGLVYIERSKTDQAGEGAYVAITPETLAALKQLREESGLMPDADVSVFGLSMSQISRRVDSMARAAGLGRGIFEPLGACGAGYQDDASGELRCRPCRRTDAGSRRRCRRGTPGARRRLRRWSGWSDGGRAICVSDMDSFETSWLQPEGTRTDGSCCNWP